METKSELDVNWAEAWEKAAKSLSKLTGTDLTKGKPLSPDEVVGQLHEIQDKDDKAKEKHAALRGALSKTLNLVMLLGGVASQAASMVFGGPSEICLNAVSQLINVGKKYEKIFSDLQKLFSNVADSLERFGIYRDIPDKPEPLLVGIANGTLKRFVDICETSIKILYRNRAKLFLKVLLFNTDDGVGAMLDDLEKSSVREHRAVSAMILKTVKKVDQTTGRIDQTTKTIDQTTKTIDQTTKTVDQTTKTIDQTTKTIDQTTGRIDQTTMTIDQNLRSVREDMNNINAMDRVEKLLGKPPVQALKDLFQSYAKNKLEGTGAWLFKDPTFKSWTDWTQTTTDSVLCLSADEGYGKTYLLTTVIEELWKRNSRRDGQDLERVSVAYSLCPDIKSTQSSNKNQAGSPQKLEEAIKAIAYQIAEVDTVYRANLQKTYGDEMKLQYKVPFDLWDKLFMQVKAESKFYIVLDGYELDELKPFIKAIQQTAAAAQADSDSGLKPQIRLLFSARSSVAEDINSDLADPMETLEVVGKNLQDIKAFVQRRVNKMKIFAENSTLDEEIRKSLKSEILTALMENSKGDFVHAGMTLDVIAREDRTKEIQELLAALKKGEHRDIIIKREIESCNSLSHEDIKDLNRLLLFVIHAESTPSVGELESLLSLGAANQSLLPLKTRIKDKFSRLLKVEKGYDEDLYVYLASDSIKEYFSEASKKRQATEESSSLSSCDTVNKFEVDVVSRLLRNMCDDKLYERFGFESFFKNKLTSAGNYVSVDMDTAQAEMVQICVQALFSSEPGLGSDVVGYARYYLADHLRKTDLSLAPIATKAEIGKSLVKLFADTRHIPRYWDPRHGWLRGDWLYNDENTDAAVKWFSDPVVTKDLDEDNLEWAQKMGTNRSLILERVMKLKAEAWLIRPDVDATNSFRFIRAYRNMLDCFKNPDEITRYTDDDDDDDNKIKAGDVEDAAAWAQDRLKIEKPHFETLLRLATTHRDLQQWDEACAGFKKAAEEAPFPHYQCIIGLARVYADKDNNEWKSAISTMDPLFENKSKIDEEDLKDALEWTGFFYEMDQQYDKAVEKWRELLAIDSSRRYAIQRVITTLCKQGRYAELIPYLQQLQGTPAKEEEGPDQLSALYLAFPQDTEFHEKLVMAAVRHSDPDETIKRSYDKASEAAEKQKPDGSGACFPLGSLEAMLYYKAHLLFTSATAPAERSRAMTLWQTIATAPSARVGSREQELREWARQESRRALITANLQAIRETGPFSAAAHKHAASLANLASLARRHNAQQRAELLSRKLGRCYRLLGKLEQARDALRPELNDALDILSAGGVAGHDPVDDWYGWQELAIVLLHYGDDDGALAAWSLIDPLAPPAPPAPPESAPVPDAPEANGAREGSNGVPLAEGVATAAPDTLVPSTEPAALAKPVGPLGFRCDGRCGLTWPLPDDMWYCRDCADVQFCGPCHELLARRELDRVVCHPGHEFLHVPPYTMAREARGGPGKVRVGDRVMEVTEWLAELRREWGLDEEKAEEGSVGGSGEKMNVEA